MISKSLYINIIIRVLFIVVFSVLVGYFIIIDKSIRFSIICVLFIAGLTINLISYLNSTNKKIRFFFDSVRNDDSSLFFLLKHEKLCNELYQSMNRVNHQIQL